VAPEGRFAARREGGALHPSIGEAGRHVEHELDGRVWRRGDDDGAHERDVRRAAADGLLAVDLEEDELGEIVRRGDRVLSAVADEAPVVDDRHLHPELGLEARRKLRDQLAHPRSTPRPSES
jgi:hypothetical protein